MVPIQLLHERRQVFRHRGASGVGEFGPQSGRKRPQEPHRVEGDGGQMAHPNAPTDLPWPNRSVARLMSGIHRTGFVPSRQQDFCGAGGSRGRQRTGHKQRGADVPAPRSLRGPRTREGASDYPVLTRSCNARFSVSIWNGFLRVGRLR
jgi:hypothetical protein